MQAIRVEVPGGLLEVRVTEDGISVRQGRGAWATTTKAALRRDYGDVAELWRRLADDHGIKKPNSGPSGAGSAQADRTNKMVSLTLPEDAREKLERLARGSNKSAVVARLIREAKE